MALHDEQLGVEYPAGRGYPEGKICLDCAATWQEEHDTAFDTSEGAPPRPVFEPFVCALCGEPID